MLHLARWSPRARISQLLVSGDAGDGAKKPSPSRRRLLGEDIAFWRDGGKVHGIADPAVPTAAQACQHGHIRFPGSGTPQLPISWLDL